MKIDPKNEVFEMKGSRLRWKEAAERKSFRGVIFSNSNGGAHELPVLRVVELWAFWLVEWLVEFFLYVWGVCALKKKKKICPPPPIILSWEQWWTIERRSCDKVVWRHATSIHELTPRIRSSKRFGEDNYESSNRKMAGCRKSVIGAKV